VLDLLTETNSTALLSPPLSLAPLLSSDSLLSPATDIKVQHGVVGLLKHLAQSSANSSTNRAFLSESGVVPRLVASGVWDQRGDAMAEVVQMGAIGVVKHLCNGNGECNILPVRTASLSFFYHFYWGQSRMLVI
jgi:hypothetical protein